MARYGYLDQQLIAHYQAEESKKNEKDVEEMIALQTAANKQIAADKVAPGVTAYNEALSRETKDAEKNYYEKHIIAVLKVPAISLDLPIFDQTNELFLRKGVSLLEGSSYPIGGTSTHAVLSSHRGLPEATLFDRLPDLSEGDMFYIEINQETHAYEVDQIKVILPTETDDLLVVDGEEYVTLLTCTPYMVNTHRLLVRGRRVPFTAENQTEIKKQKQKRSNHWWIWFSVFCTCLFMLFLLTIYKKHTNNRAFKRAEIKSKD